ncbi:MAG: di-heme oxidoredictase family protein [Chromatocurvus sp.]
MAIHDALVRVAGALLTLAIAGCHGVSESPPLAAGGSELTVNIAPAAPQDTLLQLPLGHDVATRKGEALFRRTWTSGHLTRYKSQPGDVVSRCSDCHVEATAASTPAARAATGRIAPPLFGWGLLAAVSAATLERMADSLDENADGISGKLASVPVLSTGGTAVGRFGWKSTQPDLYQQIATALMDDLNVSTPLYAEESATGTTVHVSAEQLTSIERYIERLAVPARRGRNDPEVHRGERIFSRTGCAGCHVPVLMTGDHPDPALSNQAIWPYSDLLLHDMGVALGEPSNGEAIREWRTPPLWGIGLMLDRYPQRGLLHDGRAGDLLSAIAWHGGEARAARDAALALPARDRDALLIFLRSL